MHVTRRTCREDGAVAVLAGVLFASLFLMGAMVVQYGYSRDVRRQSQNASDASALAAAQYLLKSGTPDFAGAVSTAISYASTNFDVPPTAWVGCTDPGKPSGWYSPSTNCISFDSQTAPTRVRVAMPLRESRNAVGAGAGLSSLKIGSTAVATVASTPPGLRPWGICSEQLPSAANSVVTMVFMPGNGHTSAHGCSASNAGGNWWLMRCPEDGNGGTPVTANNVLNGCDDPVSPVPNQPADNTLAAFLKSSCPGRSASCLAGDTGNNLSVFADEWQTLVGKTITVPVFCDQPACATSTLLGNGTNAIYPIWRMVSVEVCGFRLNKTDSTNWPSGTDPCTVKNTAHYTPATNWFGANEDGFFLVFRTLDKPLDASTDPTLKPWLVQ